MPSSLPRIGVSSCLLGQRVRYNGEHKRFDWAVDRLGKWVAWVAICPEMEMGLGSPREPIHLVREAQGELRGEIRLKSVTTKDDLTVLARKTAKKILARELDLDGYILKKDSPSCGQERVKVYSSKGGGPTRGAVGVFAQELLSAFPDLPVIEEGRLTDPEQREHFVTRVFAYRAFKDTPRKISALQLFHQHYKLLIMAHSPSHYQRLGKIAANSVKKPPREVFEYYERELLAGLAIPSSEPKRINVLQHIFGYFKEKIDIAEKKQVLETFDEYRSGEVPLLVPVRILRLLARKHSVEYLLTQKFFEPYPKELALRKYI